MIYLVLSDIHGNLPAFETLLKKERNNYDAVINLGDVVNYAPWSNECVQLLSTLPHVINLMGNHEEYFLKGEYSNPGKVSEIFFKVTHPTFTEQKTISTYRNNYILDNYLFIHTIENKYIFKDSVINIDKNYCIGHSHQQYKNELNNFTIINPGSVGQNRSFINLISYSLYDTETKLFEFKEIKYNIEIVINEMISQDYPIHCINYYKEKNIA